MPFLFIRICNSDFQSRDEGAHYESVEDALAFGVEGAVGVARDEVRSGASAAAVEVRVEGGGGETMLRSVVAISISPLSIVDASLDPNN